MAAFWSSGGNATTTSNYGVRVCIHTIWSGATGTATCSCTHRPDAPPRGMACVADKHKTPEDEAWEDVMRWLERRAGFRAFIGRPAPPPRARACRPLVLPPPASLAWRARALGRARVSL